MMDPEEKYFDEKFRALASAVFIRAVEDVKTKAVDPSIRLEAWKWLLNYGYGFYVDILGFHCEAKDYLSMMEEIRKIAGNKGINLRKVNYRCVRVQN